MTLPAIPPHHHINRAVAFLESAASYFDAAGQANLATQHDIARTYWEGALSDLQDALFELGYDIAPMKEQPPATPEAIYDDAAYFEGRQR